MFATTVRTQALSVVAAAAMAASLVIAANPACAVSSSRTAGAPRVRVSTGTLQGSTAEAVDSFLGIPYAAAPTGDLRWRAPQAAAAWSGTRQATEYGDSCPAAASTNGPRSETEDCLYLNVQRPATARTNSRLPVYVWIHGGGLLNGSGSQHDGSLIVQSTDAIVVTINYRLGVFGFLGHPGLTAETGESGNYGFMDQQAALWWVQKNIAAFGGDPTRVTIGGESAGGFSICAHLSAPGSQGAFASAMIQSGACLSQTQQEADATGLSVAQAADCSADSDAAAVACLRTASVATLIDGPLASATFVDGTPTLPTDPGEAVASGQFARVPVVVGANRDEGRTFSQGFIGLDEAEYSVWLQAVYPDRWERILSSYPWPDDAGTFTAAYLIGAIMTDSGMIGSIGGCFNLALTETLAEYTRTYAYEFDHRTGPGLSPTPEGYEWGAGHAAELAYLWPSFDNGTPIAPTFDASERQLSADMVRAWGSFVTVGTPAAAGSQRWPTFNTSDAVMSLRADGASALISSATVASEHACEIWTT